MPQKHNFLILFTDLVKLDPISFRTCFLFFTIDFSWSFRGRKYRRVINFNSSGALNRMSFYTCLLLHFCQGRSANECGDLQIHTCWILSFDCSIMALQVLLFLNSTLLLLWRSTLNHVNLQKDNSFPHQSADVKFTWLVWKTFSFLTPSWTTTEVFFIFLIIQTLTYF